MRPIHGLWAVALVLASVALATAYECSDKKVKVEEVRSPWPLQ